RPSAFDCSGLVHWAYQQAGVDLPRVSSAQGQVGHAVSLDDLRPGDILMWHGGGHVALYAGDGQVLHAYTTGQPVTYAPLDPSSIASPRRLCPLRPSRTPSRAAPSIVDGAARRSHASVCAARVDVRNLFVISACRRSAARLSQFIGATAPP